MAATAAAVEREAVPEAPPGSKANPMLPQRVVARRLGVSMATVRRMRKRGDFPGAQKVRGCWKMPEQEVIALASGGLTTPDQP